MDGVGPESVVGKELLEYLEGKRWIPCEWKLTDTEMETQGTIMSYYQKVDL
jgi:hypothetical protein